MKKQEIFAACSSAALIETYTVTGKGRGIHTDNLKYAGTGSYDNTEIENIPFDEDGEADVDVRIMGKEEYENTILVNSSEAWPEDLTDEDKIAVIIINE